MLPLFPRPEKIKGLYYFDEQFGRGERWYRSHFPTRATRALASTAGSATPSSPARRRRTTCTTRSRRARPGRSSPRRSIIVSLRDPVERAFSHYKERRANDTEPLSFADAIAAEPTRLAGEEARIVADPGT